MTKVLTLNSDGSHSEVDIPVNPVVSTPGWASTLSLNTSGINVIRILLSGPSTTLNFNAGVDGQKLMLELIQDSNGNRQISLGTGVKLGTDITSLTLSTGANAVDYVGLIYKASTGNWNVIAYARGY